MTDVQSLTIDDVYEGQEASFKTTILGQDIEIFARLTGDVSPLHMNQEFAENRGFKARVAHGALLCGYISRLFGVHLPGENCLLQSVKVNFIAPAQEGDEIEVKTMIKQVSHATRTIVAAVSIENVKTGQVLVRGKVQAGFTNSAEE